MNRKRSSPSICSKIKKQKLESTEADFDKGNFSNIIMPIFDTQQSRFFTLDKINKIITIFRAQFNNLIFFTVIVESFASKI